MADEGEPMPSTNMGKHHFDTVLIHMDILRYPSEHSVDGQPQDDNNIPNYDQISEIRNTIFMVRALRILTQGSRHPLPHIWICDWYPPDTGTSRNEKNHGYMVQQSIPCIRKASCQRPHQSHQWHHDIKLELLHHPRNRNHLLHSGRGGNPLSQDMSTLREHSDKNFLPFATGLKWSPRK